MAIFKGSGVALVTPFLQNGDVDYEGLRRLVDFHVEGKSFSARRKEGCRWPRLRD